MSLMCFFASALIMVTLSEPPNSPTLMLDWPCIHPGDFRRLFWVVTNLHQKEGGVGGRYYPRYNNLEFEIRSRP